MSAIKKQKKAVREAGMQTVGLSSDLRTNRWHVYCVCGQTNKPSTTMLSTQIVTCERCDRMYHCNYNQMTIKEITQ
jgi:hypothetical protein